MTRGRSALIAALCTLCQGTKYAHSLLRLGRFRDGGMEARYQDSATGWYTVIAVLHGAFMMVWTVAFTINSVVSDNYSLALWGSVARTLLSLCLLLVVLPFQSARRHVVPLHAAYCVAMNVLTAWMAHAVWQSLAAATDRELAPLLDTCLRAADPQGVVLQLILAFSTSSSQQTYAALAQFQLCALAFIGLNPWTILAMASYPATLLGEMAFSSTAPYIGLAASEYCTSLAIFLVMAACLEQLRRSAYTTECLLAQELHNTRASHSILNHTLKNTLADAAGNIEVYLRDDNARAATLLQDSLLCLRRGIKYCRDRQAYLKLVAGAYVTTFKPVRLAEFAEQLVAGRAVTVEVIDKTVMLDVTLLNLVLDNALHNAFKHGCPENAAVHFTIQSCPRPEPAAADTLQLRFAVTNTAHPDRPPLTPEYVARVLAGDPLPRTSDLPWLSDQIGLSHCLLAAQAHDATVSLSQDGDKVTFTACLFAKVTHPSPVPLLSNDLLSCFPSGLTFFILDDSPSALRLMESQLLHGASPAAVRAYGLREEELASFIPTARREADIVICDQNLQYGSKFHLGTDIISALATSGFTGLLCIRSANMDPDDAALYRRCGAHCTLGKELSFFEFITAIKLAYIDLKHPEACIAAPGSVYQARDTEVVNGSLTRTSS